MKKIILIGFVFISVLTFGQRNFYVDSINMADITGTDTILWFPTFYFGNEIVIEIEYFHLGSADGTYELIGSNHTTQSGRVQQIKTLNNLNSTIFPFVLDNSSYDVNYDSDTLTTTTFKLDGMYKFYARKITKPTTATGKLYERVYQK